MPKAIRNLGDCSKRVNAKPDSSGMNRGMTISIVDAPRLDRGVHLCGSMDRPVKPGDVGLFCTAVAKQTNG